MSYKITIANNGQVFEADPGETILDAALRQKVQIRYGCRQGKCSTCKHLMLDGEYDDSTSTAYALMPAERDEGMSLLCQAYPESDCTVQLLGDPPADDTSPPVPQSFVGRLMSAERLTPTVWSVRVALDAPIRFLPGQYAEVSVPGRPGMTRTYSMASPSSGRKRMEFLIQEWEDGVFSMQLDGLEPGTPFDMSGPYGDMHLRPTERPIVLIGQGAGVGPLVSIVRTARMKGWGAGMQLLHLAPTAEEHAYRSQLTELAERHPDFLYRPLVDPLVKVITREFDSGFVADVYVAGNAEFCEQATFLLEAQGFDPERIFIDRFYATQGD